MYASIHCTRAYSPMYITNQIGPFGEAISMVNCFYLYIFIFAILCGRQKLQ